MSNFLTIEPSRKHAPAFAAWCLSRDRNVQTVSAGGFLVPVDWYPDVPPELLSGSVVDGFPYDRPSPQPKLASPSQGPPDVPATASAPNATKRTTRPRKRAAKKVPEA